MSSDLRAIHPELPGDATIGSMVRGFAPFTRGRRPVFVVGVVLSLVLFALAAWLPLLTGTLLETALDRAQSDSVLRRYVADTSALRATTADVYAESSLSEDEVSLVAKGVQAASDRALAIHGDELLDSLFPNGLSYATTASIDRYIDNSFGSTKDRWKEEVRALAADSHITRAEVEALHDHVDGITQPVGDRAFNFTVAMLADDADAKSQRSHAQNVDLLLQIVRFALVVAAVLVLRWVTASIMFSFTTWSARRLQDEVFEQVSDSLIVESGALGRPSMISRCTSYVDKVESALIGAQTVGVQAVAGVVLSLALVVWIDVPTGLIMIGIVAVFEIVRRLVQRRWSDIGHRRLDASTRLSELVDDSITHSTASRAAGSVDLERAQFSELAETVRHDTIALEKFGEGFALAALTIAQIGIVITVAVIGFARNDLSLAAATATLLYVRTLGESIANIPGVLVELHEAAPYMRRIQRVLAGRKRHGNVDEVTITELPAGPMVLDAVSFTAPDGARGCTDIDLVVPVGERRFVVGGVGSVRDAVAIVASGLDVPDAGVVRVGESDLSRMGVSTVRRGCGLIAPDPVVLTASLRANLTTLAPDADDAAIESALAGAGLTELVERLPNGLDELLGHGGRRLSPVDRARLGIARVLLARPVAIVVDDPWTAIEPDLRAQLWASVRSSFAALPLLVVTSDLSWIEDGDVVCVLGGSGIATTGTRAELLTNDQRFRDLWDRSTGSGVDADDLAEVPSLAALSERARRRLAAQMVTERFDTDDVIFDVGDDADALYFVVDGSVVLTEGDRRVATVGRGDHFGDLDVGGVQFRTVSARALVPTVVRRLHRLAISQGVFAQLDRAPLERAVVRLLTREGASSTEAIAALGNGALAALDALIADGAVIAIGDGDVTTYRMAGSQRRAPQSARAAASLLDELIDE